MPSDGRSILRLVERRTNSFRSLQCSSLGMFNILRVYKILMPHHRPRGWHLDETRLTVDNTPVSASIFDFAIYFFHNAHELVKRGHGPYFYLPKMEHYLEARLWNDIFLFSQAYLGLPHNTIRATVLIETLPAAFQMEEILFELRNHSSGLNCGR